MTWLVDHRLSERYASEAHMAVLDKNMPMALGLYSQAARMEMKALISLTGTRPRTWGVTAVSAVSLLIKAEQWAIAGDFAHKCLEHSRCPEFAKPQLKELLATILEKSKIDPQRYGHATTGGSPDGST